MSGASDAAGAGATDDTGGLRQNRLLLRWVAFVVAMVVLGYGLDFLVGLGVLEGTTLVNVFIGIALSLAIIAVVVGAGFLVTGAIRTARRRRS